MDIQNHCESIQKLVLGSVVAALQYEGAIVGFDKDNPSFAVGGDL